VTTSPETSVPAKSSRGLLVGIFVGAAGLAVGAWSWTHKDPHGADTVPAAGRSEISAAGNAVKISTKAPQWDYLSLSVAKVSKPLPPVPAPARVLVDEARSNPVFATLPGRVEQITVQLGQVVKAGDRILSIRSSSLPELGRDVESARAALALKSSQLERVRDLVKVGALAGKDVLTAEQERREVELTLKAAEGKRRSLRVGALDEGGLYWLTASRAGTVVERHALVGMEVGPDRTDPLVSIADLTEVIVVADVLESDIQSTAKGQMAQISAVALGPDGLPGKIEHVSEAVDPVRRTVSVRLRVVNPGHKLRPNAFAQVAFAPEGADRVVVPSEAVVTDDQTTVMFIKTSMDGGQTTLERRPVQLGRVRGDQSEVVSGLAAGETFVSRGALLVLNTLDLAR
jgi:cobalt-zinc-cadmium efflux system membrane fusion protein